jgi:hypothetical protein
MEQWRRQVPSIPMMETGIPFSKTPLHRRPVDGRLL